MKLPSVTFETKCWEQDWELICRTNRLQQIIEHLNFPFTERILMINNVTDTKRVQAHAQILVNSGILTSYYVVADYAKEALAFFHLTKEDLNKGYYYSIAELTSIYLAKTDYLLHQAGDVTIPKKIKNNWISSAIQKMQKTPHYTSANLIWNNDLAAVKNETIDSDDNFWITTGFSDQQFLIKTAMFQNDIYRETCHHAEHFPAYGGELFEKRVYCWMRNHDYHRLTYQSGSYIHHNCEPLNWVQRLFLKKL